jgi:hypothetical protein
MPILWVHISVSFIRFSAGYPQLFIIEGHLELEVLVSSASLTLKVDAPGRTWTCIASHYEWDALSS